MTTSRSSRSGGALAGAASGSAAGAAAQSPPAVHAVALIEQWFQQQRWSPFDFQREVWQAVSARQSGLLHATTGAGKTYAVWFAALINALSETATGRRPRVDAGSGALKVLWITPMRALAADTARALSEPLALLGPELERRTGQDWQVGLRTGDTSSAERQRQARRLPAALITTPESASLLLTRPESPHELGALRLVVIDEWHELMGNKRGVQTQLVLARLRRFNPGLAVWGLSATLGNLEHAMQVLLGKQAGGRLVQGELPKSLRVDTLLPATTERFPWGGHLGIRMLEPVVREIDSCASTLVFTNTRSQAELWYHALLAARPDWAGIIALHHGSLDKGQREWVEAGLKEGRLKAVVCTSSLDLGVDFSPVERVLQIGSPKGIARLLQRAGRSGHSPGRPSRVSIVPTNALELIESAGAQDAAAARRIEARAAPDKPLDVLVQHLVSIALGTGFVPDDLLAEVRGCAAYSELTADEFAWALDFVTRGGQSLKVYPEYRRVVPDEQGVYRVPDRMIAKRHRMSVGTIVADAVMQVKYMGGRSLGTIEESFISRLRKGDHFLFGGRTLELIRVHEMTAYVRRATGRRGAVPRWGGGKMPLSSELADAVLARLEQARQGHFDGPEMQLVRPLLELQARWSGLPTGRLLVAESLHSREGHHLFVYPLAGRNVHIGLASLLAWRISKEESATFSIAVSDYGFELLSPEPVDWGALRAGTLLAGENLQDDILASLNSSELALRRFREIARVSGLVFQGLPGAPRSTRQLQASAGLFFEVFRKHDAGNRLLSQADAEVLSQELELGRLRQTLARLAQRELMFVELQQPTPFAFPLMVERFREMLSTEKLSDRIARMLKDLERAAS